MLLRPHEATTRITPKNARVRDFFRMSILTNCQDTTTNHNSLGLGASKCNCHEIPPGRTTARAGVS